MTPSDVIESYVVDVARHLPGRLRADIVSELRELLTESLHERFGPSPTAGQASDLVRAFGRPQEAAARYQPPFALIDPTDTRLFITLAIIGSAVAGVGKQLLIVLDTAKAEGAGAPEFLVGLFLFFAIRAWIHRVSPERRPPWKPTPVKPWAPSWPEIAGSAVFSIAFVIVYLAPGPVLNFITGGAVGGERLAYTDSFQHWTRIGWIPLLLAVNVLVQIAAGLRKSWTTRLALADIFTQIVLILQIGWHLSYGKIFVDPRVERAASVIAATVALIWAIEVGVKIYRYLGRIPSPAITARLQDAHERGVRAARRLAD